ncbi:MAG: ferredoxin--NADP(+) reductase [Gordonia sp. (in: high G+C Gram-positive bacteria)]|nr:MAG: ferredoxin--NADP(+) reductase [Gordonia sp. (in: high G+C Gram-positive bacteria)]
MAYVITETCVDIQDKSCVEECPVDCIYEGPRMMYINPEECVECGRCEPVCPTISIFHEEDLPDDRADYRDINEAVFVDLGMPAPGGARLLGPLATDHPTVAALPITATAPRATVTSAPAPAVAQPDPVEPESAVPVFPPLADPAAGDRREVDVVVIGAGPVGLYAAYYAGFRGMSVAIIDSLPEPGGQCSALYPEKELFDIAGFPAIKGQALVDGLVAQAQNADPLWLLGERAERLETSDTGVEIATDRGTIVSAKGLVIAGGIGNFEPRVLEPASRYLGIGLRYFVPRLSELAGRDVVVVGGGDSAVDWALSLEDIAASVTLVHRREQFRAHEQSILALRGSTVKVLTPYEVGSVGGADHIGSVSVVNTADGSVHELAATEVVAALGFIADLGPLQNWGLELQQRRIMVDRSMRTNLQRVFAVGDIADFEGKIRIIAVGFAEAATAINHIAPLVNSTWTFSPGHSSDMVK